jgi:anti-sigma factor RsiW
VSGCAQVGPELLDGYLRGRLDLAAAWSVEAHVPGCPDCRAAVTAGLELDRLDRNRSVLLVRLALPSDRPLWRLLRRCRVPEHVVTLLSATPSLRRSWLAGMVLVLLAVVGWAQLAARAGLGAGPGSVAGGLLPFLLLAPLLPLAAVAVAFSVRLDPSHELAVAAPVSGAWLLCVRAVAVIGATLVPTSLAALALPGPHWLPLALLLPALAVCSAALAAATVVGPEAGAAVDGVAWVAAITVAGQAGHGPASAFGRAGQLTAAAVLLAALALLAARRGRLELRWRRD